jgi:hypothetical protein
MKIWIRSQNKSRLLYIDKISIEYFDEIIERRFFMKDKIKRHWYIYDNKYIELGEYSSYKKCLKVLDMIQKYIQSGVNEYMVFQMPQDEKVKL